MSKTNIDEVLQALEHGEIMLPCGYGKYYVSNYGRVWNGRTGHFLKPEITHHNYLRVHMSINGVRVNKYVHKLVADIFTIKPRGSTEIHHIDGDKHNNRASNLMSVTRQQHRALHKDMKVQRGCAA